VSTCAALIVAAGRGQRFGGSGPKQYAPLRGEPLLRRTLRTFISHPNITKVVVAIHPDDETTFANVTEGLDTKSVHGGATRQESVLRGLEGLVADAPDLVLIHDGARPVLSHHLIDAVIGGLAKAEGALPIVPVVDTLKKVNGNFIGETVPRENLVRAQTPQGFHFPLILSAHREQAGQALTDDAAVFECAGYRLITVLGDEANIKVTTMDDLARLNASLSETRVGQGFDVHKFGPGDHATLCGLKIPHTKGLEGHSDADVALHAAADAILGSIGAGDIGQYFPPTDKKWRGVASDKFIQHAYKLMAERGGALMHLDVTIICEKPKIGPHREAMVKSIARILDLDTDRISVKATTTEGLGFTGRGEGIAAQAVATIRI
jgi:2-C-methyl-D-erythritol 4-phosphate cytidylyltransferase/2-C-methyl-D-erythritol 2,4-cyclodiphosphate synthase